MEILNFKSTSTNTACSFIVSFIDLVALFYFTDSIISVQTGLPLDIVLSLKTARGFNEVIKSRVLPFLFFRSFRTSPASNLETR